MRAWRRPPNWRRREFRRRFWRPGIALVDAFLPSSTEHRGFRSNWERSSFMAGRRKYGSRLRTSRFRSTKSMATAGAPGTARYRSAASLIESTKFSETWTPADLMSRSSSFSSVAAPIHRMILTFKTRRNARWAMLQALMRLIPRWSGFIGSSKECRRMNGLKANGPFGRRPDTLA